MTVRLLADYALSSTVIIPAGRTAWLPSAVEAGLIADRLAVTASTVDWWPPVEEFRRVPHPSSRGGIRTVLFGHSYIDAEAGGNVAGLDAFDNWSVLGTTNWANWLMGKPLQVIREVGHGSRRVLDMLPRYRDQVAPIRPQVLIVSLGHNDLKGLYEGERDQAPPDPRQREVPYLVQCLRQWLMDEVSPGVTVFLLAETPPGVNPSGVNSGSNNKNLGARFLRFNEALRQLAQEFANVVYVPLDWVTLDPASLTMRNRAGHYWDQVHPGIVGSNLRGRMLASYMQRALKPYCDDLCISQGDTFTNTKISTSNQPIFNGVSARLDFANVLGTFRYIEAGDWVTVRIIGAANRLLAGRYTVMTADDAGCVVATPGVFGTATAVAQVSNSNQLFVNPLFLQTTGGRQGDSAVSGTISGNVPLGVDLVNVPASWTMAFSTQAHVQRDGSPGFGNWLVIDITVSGSGGPTTAYLNLPISTNIAGPASYDNERKLVMGTCFKAGCEVRQEPHGGGSSDIPANGFAGFWLQNLGSVVNQSDSGGLVSWHAQDMLRTADTPVGALHPWPLSPMTVTLTTPEMRPQEDPATRYLSQLATRFNINFQGNGTVRLMIGRFTVRVVDDPVEMPRIALK